VLPATLELLLTALLIAWIQMPSFASQVPVCPFSLGSTLPS
jgi:hypothetical protein